MVAIIILLVLASLLNLVLAFIVWRRNYRNLMNIFYSLANFGVFLWVISQVGIFLAINPTVLYCSWVASYVSGAFIAINLVIFSFYFPFAKNVNKWLIFTIYLSFFILLFFLFTPGVIIKQISSEFSLVSSEIRAPLLGSVVYGLYFVFMFCVAFKNFIEKYVGMDGFAKSQIKLILIGVSASFFISLISNIIAPIYIGPAIGWLGPLSSVIMAFFAAHLLYFKRGS